jgi:peroxiredoxin Q/BCP
MKILENGLPVLDDATGEPLKIGDRAPDFTYVDQNGKPVSLSSLQGRPTVLYILGRLKNGLTARKFERLVNLAPEIDAAGANVIALSTTYFRDAKLEADRLGFTFPILDNEADLAGINTYAQPTDIGSEFPVYVLTADHTIAYMRIGDDVFDEVHSPELIAAIGAATPATFPRPPAPVVTPPVTTA